MADGRHLKTLLSLKLSHRRSDFDKLWCTDADFDYMNEYEPKSQNFANSRWRTASILKLVLSLYLSRGSPDIDEIRCPDALSPAD